MSELAFQRALVRICVDAEARDAWACGDERWLSDADLTPAEIERLHALRADRGGIELFATLLEGKRRKRVESLLGPATRRLPAHSWSDAWPRYVREHPSEGATDPDEDAAEFAASLPALLDLTPATAALLEYRRLRLTLRIELARTPLSSRERVATARDVSSSFPSLRRPYRYAEFDHDVLAPGEDPPERRTGVLLFVPAGSRTIRAARIGSTGAQVLARCDGRTCAVELSAGFGPALAAPAAAFLEMLVAAGVVDALAAPAPAGGAEP